MVSRRLGVCAAVAALAVALGAYEPLPQDRGASGAWQKLLKLNTIASVLHTTAHPDDEHGGLLAMLSRGAGARVALLTLTRGEAGDNAIGSELFDALGLVRTEELLRADQYYGVDQQYFATVIDYGFSKRLEEALVKWGRENVLRDVVRVIRIERPLVLIARFQGNDRDGHGNHQTAGLITQDAYRVSGDASVFPEQMREGLRPWQPLKLYMGGVRENEDWTIRVDTGVYSSWLGDTYGNFARTGLSFQRSQNSGRTDQQPGATSAFYRRLASRVAAAPKEMTFFDGIDTRVTGLFSALQHPAPPQAASILSGIQREIDAARQAFTFDNPSAPVGPLARGLSAVRDARKALAVDPDAAYVLTIKEQQFADAINAALGIEFTALAATAGPVVPGQSFDVAVQFANHGSTTIEGLSVAVLYSLPSPAGVGAFGAGAGFSPSNVGRDETRVIAVHATVPASMPVTRPYFARGSLIENRYSVDAENAVWLHRPWAPPAFTARATYNIGGVPVEISVPVTRREPQPPYGSVVRELAVVPPVAVNVTPLRAIAPLYVANNRLVVHVELVNHAAGAGAGQVVLKLPRGWTSIPATMPFTFTRAGERADFRFVVGAGALDSREYRIEAVASSNGREYTEGFDVIEHRDLETRYLYRPAATVVRGVDVRIAPGLRVGYVMGVGDDVPTGIAQLGAQVKLLDSQDLASADLSQFHTIMTGTRAYGVREDLRTYNRRLLEYVRGGGNLIVLYNTPGEFDPRAFAPYPADLPRNAEEVSEEDSPVEILAPSRAEFTTPNRITKADFDGWVEQRGSKFFSQWDAAYTPMIETHDRGQPPQRGGWVTAAYGKGHYTYLAYAFHRQLPYGVPGAYRLLANLLSMGAR